MILYMRNVEIQYTALALRCFYVEFNMRISNILYNIDRFYIALSSLAYPGL